MLTIYGVHRSRASRNIWLAHEIGLQFRHVPVIQAYRLSDPHAPGAPLNTRSSAFLKINPNGHVPSLDDDGLVLHESLAINLYLAKRYGGALGPADIAEDGQMGMWTLWASTEVEPHSIKILNHRVSYSPADRDPAVAQAAIDALRTPISVLDREVAATGFLGWRALHCGGRECGRGRPLRTCCAGTVRGHACASALARGLPCPARL